MQWIWILILASCSSACSFDGQSLESASAGIQKEHQDSIPNSIFVSGKTVETRFPVPEGFVRLPTDADAFGAYLRRLPLHPDGYPVHLYDGRLKRKQDTHCAVIDLDVGNRDLQQCADAVIRLRAEYLFEQKRYADIHFNFTNGFKAEYTRWRRGERIRVEENRVYWTAGNAPSGSYADFRKYLDVVFAYAGTASLERELHAAEPTALLPGDVWIKGAYPGHAVIVLDVVEQPGNGERRFLLAQSYIPAQEIHVLLNPADGSPWYSTDRLGEKLVTPEWVFERGQLRR